MRVCGVRPGGQRSPVELGQLRRGLTGLQVQELEDVDLPLDTDLQDRTVLGSAAEQQL